MSPPSLLLVAWKSDMTSSRTTMSIYIAARIRVKTGSSSSPGLNLPTDAKNYLEMSSICPLKEELVSCCHDAEHLLVLSYGHLLGTCLSRVEKHLFYYRALEQLFISSYGAPVCPQLWRTWSSCIVEQLFISVTSFMLVIKHLFIYIIKEQFCLKL
jgi:hypothetical protein